MVFSSVPFNLDPSNWQQQEPNHHQHGSSSENPEQIPQRLPPVGGSSSSIRPGSMADRARLAKMPQPETALKCPRCESSNTKFCYFNNYNLSQPRHFCKTCRRYWTKGGALRNVPVGGGCRRNKRSKSRSSKSPVTGDRRMDSASTSAISSNTCTNDMIMCHMATPHSSQSPFIPSLHHFSDYTSGDMAGLNFVGLQPPVMVETGNGGGGNDMDFQLRSNSGGSATVLPAGNSDQWRFQQIHQFPFMAGLEPPQGLYPFDGEGMVQGYTPGTSQIPAKPSGSGITRFASVKMEDNHGLNLSRQFLGIPGSEHYWGSGGGGGNINAWTDLSGFTSSSTNNL